MSRGHSPNVLLWAGTVCLRVLVELGLVRWNSKNENPHDILRFFVLFFVDHGPTMCLHKLPHLARPTANELPPHQHEKVSFVCVRVQSPTGLELVPCALSAVDKLGRKKY